jgi:hypothetical protein
MEPFGEPGCVAVPSEEMNNRAIFNKSWHSHPLVAFFSITSTSSCSITSRTRLRLSMKEFTATRSIRFVVALYSTRSTVWPGASVPGSCETSAGTVVDRALLTSEESSTSTLMAFMAIDASRADGNGILRTLGSDVSTVVQALNVGGVI